MPVDAVRVLEQPEITVDENVVTDVQLPTLPVKQETKTFVTGVTPQEEELSDDVAVVDESSSSVVSPEVASARGIQAAVKALERKSSANTISKVELMVSRVFSTPPKRKSRASGAAFLMDGSPLRLFDVTVDAILTLAGAKTGMPPARVDMTVFEVDVPGDVVVC